MRAGLYARVSTASQSTEAQLEQLRAFADARRWDALAYVDAGISGAKESRPGLDELLAAARRRRVDVIVCTKLDRLARSLHQLVGVGRELAALGVDLVVLDQAIDTTTPVGRLLFHMLAAVAEFERDLIRERVVAGIRRAQAKGVRLGRRAKYELDGEEVERLFRAGRSLSSIARELGAGDGRPQTILVTRVLRKRGCL